MPTYPYRCETCGHEWEQVQGINEPDAACPVAIAACTEHSVERLIGSTNFSLKGSGWYKDGYASTK
jgi:putative FmdB family regulatory protein